MTLTLAAGGMESSAVALLVVLACAGVIALVMARLKVAALPAYLVGGAIIGPSGLGLGVEGESMGGLAQLATVMLMFGIGLHLDLSAFRKGAAATLGAGAIVGFIWFCDDVPGDRQGRVSGLCRAIGQGADGASESARRQGSLLGFRCAGG